MPNQAGNPLEYPGDNVDKLVSMFPSLSVEQLKYLYIVCKESFMNTIELALSGPSVGSLLKHLRSLRITLPSEEYPRIRVEAEDDDDEWLSAALSFYKTSNFLSNGGVRISIHGQPGIDTGGLRRQFFSVVFSALAKSSASICFFDGPPNRLRPAFKASSLSSGTLELIGTMIAHSLLLDGQGFPYLAEYCYYYLANCFDQAVTSITVEDVGIGVNHVINEVHVCAHL